MPKNALGKDEMHAHPRLSFSPVPLDTLGTAYFDTPFGKGMYGIDISYLKTFPPNGNHGIFFPLGRELYQEPIILIFLLKK